MDIGRARRFEQRKPRLIALFGDDAKKLQTVSCVFDLMEMAWHDCYGGVAPDDVVDNVMLCSEETLDGLVDAARLAVIDSRDLSVRASEIRRRGVSA